jgi:preprotein translocase subunit SecG
MKDILQVVEIVLAIFLSGVILFQQRGTGIGGAFGSEGFAFRGRRGVERFLFNATIVLTLGFIGVAIALLLVTRS